MAKKQASGSDARPLSPKFVGSSSHLIEPLRCVSLQRAEGP
ncbi:hypothetical protein EMEDMD4_90050 [Sinorhizobium medicae]|uniref:Uncharacterized protein n=1 Tax=Sinorhizobium medicae TaxID=110321 RepID=A0A508X721_9HYPH|nr:hypothetical protein EMEDMD4_90050 [Sinorhizobium medicae]